MQQRVEPSWDDLRRRHPDAPEDVDGYGPLARLEVPPRLTALWLAIEEIGPDTMPPQAKRLRSQLRWVVDLLDLFAFAYDPKPFAVPGVFDDDDDPWEVVRSELERGYERVAALEDLGRADHDPHELASRRYEVLAWTSRVLAPPRRRAYSAYIGRPSLDRLHDRREGHRPRLFWREPNAAPRKRLSGLGNVARLARSVVSASRDDLELLADLDRIHDARQQASFHDFRLRLRAVHKLATYFPEVVRPREGAQDRLARIIETIDRYGELSDRLGAYARAVDRGRDERARTLRQQIADDWKALRKWQRKSGLGETLQDLRKDLHKP
ncbi:MAG: hypothetical protein AB1Z98_03105 [Nannocystaceae bacterium]